MKTSIHSGQCEGSEKPHVVCTHALQGFFTAAAICQHCSAASFDAARGFQGRLRDHPHFGKETAYRLVLLTGLSLSQQALLLGSLVLWPVLHQQLEGVLGSVLVNGLGEPVERRWHLQNISEIMTTSLGRRNHVRETHHARFQQAACQHQPGMRDRPF